MASTSDVTTVRTRSHSRRRRALAPAFERARVADAMQYGLLTCGPAAGLGVVAGIMAGNDVHCVAVRDVGQPAGVGFIFPVDLACARAGEGGSSAGEIARPAVTVNPEEPLARAALLMRDKGVTHLLVVEPGAPEPVGLLSSMDLAYVMAWGVGSDAEA